MKRGDSYSVRYKYKDHSGKPCEGWESFKTRKEAQERKITVEKELLDGTFLVPDTITVEEMLYKWIPIQSTKHKWSPKTYTQSVAMVQNLIVPYIGNRKVQELRTYDIEKFYATLAKTPCGQYVHGVKQKLSDKQKKRLLSSTSIHEVHTLLKTAFSYAVEWDLIHKIPLPRDAPKVNIEERTIWDEKTMLAALQTIENPALHLAVHMSMILSLREGEILGLQPSDLDFDAADGRGTIPVSKTIQRANKDALEKLDPKQVYYTFPDRREGSKSSLILKKPKTKKSNRILYMTKPLKEELQAKISPSILSADFANLERDIHRIADADYVHVDVMDGVFVPNISIGIPVLKSIRKVTDMFLDVHLMITQPVRYVEQFCDAGADLVTVHVEADFPENIQAAIDKIHAKGKKAGIVLKPKTTWEAVLPYIDQVELILVMTVEPGFGGQKFMADQMPKVAAIRKLINQRNPACELEVDGGVAPDTCRACIDAGANVLVAGSAVYKAEDIPARIKLLRGE